MQVLLNWIVEHAGLSIVGGSVIGAAVLNVFAPKAIKAATAALGKFMGSEIAKAENFATGDPAVDGRLNLAVLCLMDVANKKMPTAPGLDKKKYVMSFFANVAPALQTVISGAIDQLWATMKTSIDAGVTVPQEAIIDEAIAKLKALNPPAATPPAPPPAA